MANNQSVDDIWMLLLEVRITGELEEGRSVTSVTAEFGIAHSIVSRLWRQFQTTGTAIRGSVVVVHEEPHPQMTSTLSYMPEETGGRQREKSLDIRHRGAMGSDSFSWTTMHPCHRTVAAEQLL
ncbi:hypothetical protein TNCV_406781, partial [Trichonephila clavipes]